MKAGANNSQVTQIRRYKKEGLKAKEISEIMNIDLKCVSSFMNYDPVLAAKILEEKSRDEYADGERKRIIAEAAIEAALKKDAQDNKE